MSSRRFHTQYKETAHRITLYLSGELDLAASSSFRVISERVASRKEKPLVINLNELTYIDSSGIGQLVLLLKCRTEMNADFYVESIPSKIQRLFDMTGLTRFLKPVPPESATIPGGG
ncbi:STAS domain-containing protein [Paenibacillus sp. J2TS4]|uniref:STAS domain-containing protein n=1 Tax=Paenibacillus sp. J2TS4 TaxID=2807194 RepID=UPI001BCBDD59|nr:STAS domain-containing protein [Paenibacillus sp. J2TS4]